MTHATKAIYRWLLSDFVKVSNISTDQMLFTEQDLEASMDKIDTLNFHEEREVIKKQLMRDIKPQLGERHQILGI